ncbi:MAG: GAF domain-containing protein [Gammaproteobacteria bacterium]
MSRLLTIRLLATLIGVGCFLAILLYPRSGVLPFNAQPAGAYSLVVQPDPHYAMPRGLHAGDRIGLRDQTVATRILFAIGHAPVGTPLSFVVRRAGATMTVTFTLPPHYQPVDARVLDALVMAILLVLGLVTLWWGRDWLAWGLSLFGLGIIGNTFLSLPFSVGILLPAALFSDVAILPLLLAGLFLTALALVRDALSHRTRLAFLVLFVAAVIGVTAYQIAGNVTIVALGYMGLGNAAWKIVPLALFLLAVTLPLLTILAGYRRASAERRLRIRWILWSLALFIASIYWNNISHATTAWGIGAWWVVTIVSLTGLLYAVLRHRVVVLSFVVNRAIAFSLSAGLVVGLFALLQTIIENTALNQKAGLFLTVVVSVAMGLGFDVVRGRINRAIELVFFRSQYRAATALERFASQCHFIESENELLDQTVDETTSSIGALGVALYERVPDGYRLLRNRGAQTFPPLIKLDDRAFVALRAERREQDLNGLHSALGANGYAFPMTVRGTLLGALVCGARSEQYTPAERTLLSRLAHEVGNALNAMRARENEALVEALAIGEAPVDSLRARALHLYQDRP